MRNNVNRNWGGGIVRAALVALAVFSVFLILSQQAGAQTSALTVTNLRFNSATLTFTCSTCPSGGWYYAQSSNPSGTCSSNIPSGTYTAQVTGLSPDTEYSYLAYDDSGCNNRIVQNPVTFTTPALTASGITETSATLTLKNWSAAWWYKQQDTTDCKKVSAGTSTASLAGLQRGSTYKYYAYSSTGCSGSFVHFLLFQTTVPTGRPPKLDGFKVTTGSAFNQLDLKWTKPSNGWDITSYYVMYKMSSESSYSTSKAGDEDATSYTLSGLQPDSTYNLKMYYAATPNDKKPHSFAISYYSYELDRKTKPLPVAPPGAVTNLKVTASSPKTLTASWGAVSGAAGYNVKLSEGGYDKHAWQASSTSYKIESTYLTVGKTYTVRVQARKTGGTVGPWSSATGVPLSAAPGQVTGVSVTSGVGELTVSWSAVSGATGYKVQWKSSGQSNWSQNTLSGGNTTTSTITGLTAGTAYTVQVRATKTNAFDGTWSASKTGTPKDTAPGKVTGVTVTPGTKQLTVSWSAVTGATGYKVQWKSGAQSFGSSNENTVSGGSTTTSTITGLTAGTVYTVQVIAIKTNADGGTPSDTATGTPKDTPAGRVTGVSVTPGVEQLSVSWSAVSGATGYKVQWKSGNESFDSSRQNTVSSGSTTTSSITGLTAGTEYTVQVIATKTNADDGTPSLLRTGTPKDNPPGQVTGVAATPGNETEQLTVSWSMLSEATGYKVQWKSAAQSFDSSRQNTVSSGSTTTSTITGLTDITEYTVRVIATRTNADDGTPSDTATGTPNAPLPGQVTGVTLTTPAERQITVSWSVLSDATGYKVQWKSGNESFDSSRQNTVNSGSTTTSDITGLTGGTEYTVRVIATRSNALGDGPPSNEATETAKYAKPARVTGVAVTSGTEQLKVTWDPVSDADLGYKVQWKSGNEDWDADDRQETVEQSITTYDIIGLNAGTYEVRVAAMRENAVSDGDWSTQVSGSALAQVSAAPLQGGTSGGSPPDSPDDRCPDYPVGETAGDVERDRDPDTLVGFVQDARFGVESILSDETEESEAIDRLVDCFGVDGEWKSGSIYLFAITDGRKYFLAPRESDLAGTQLDLVDENGCDVAAELIRAARGEELLCKDLGLLPDGEPAGFVQYLWDNPSDPGDNSEPGYEDRKEAPGNSPKLSYVEKITDENILPDGFIILGSGYYPNWNPPDPSPPPPPPPTGGDGDGGGGCAVAGNGSTPGGAVLNLVLAAGFLAAFAASRKKFRKTGS